MRTNESKAAAAARLPGQHGLLQRDRPFVRRLSVERQPSMVCATCIEQHGEDPGMQLRPPVAGGRAQHRPAAAGLGAHREAAAQVERALRFSSGAPPAVLAARYDALARSTGRPRGYCSPTAGRSDIEKLPHARFRGQVAHRPFQERAVGPHGLEDAGERLESLLGRCPVGREVVLAAQLVVVAYELGVIDS